MSAVLAVDQGTTGTKAFLLTSDGQFKRVFRARHRQIYPQAGWVEHDPLELADHVEQAVAAGLEVGSPAAAGIANQGETVIAWDAETKEPLYNAIVWQDQRTSKRVNELRRDGAEQLTQERAGLPLDPYFSASKLKWLIDNAPGARSHLDRGRLRLGTSEVYFLDRLAGIYATDVTTASRTSLMNIDTLEWDPELCRLFGVPLETLPEIRPTTNDFGNIRVGTKIVPVTASVVDQQAALFGHRCFDRGGLKITFGTGAFALANAGNRPVRDPATGVVTTVGWQLFGERPVYAVDGGLYTAASSLDWAQRIGLFNDFEELSQFGAPRACEKGLYFVPALSGLACPHWDRNATGLWIGMDLNTERVDLVKAIVEGVAFRATELVQSLGNLVGRGDSVSVDGGLTNSVYFCETLAHCLEREVRVPGSTEITALGTGFFALLGAGLLDEPRSLPQAVDYRRRYYPSVHLRHCLERFKLAVDRAKAWREYPEKDRIDAS